MGMLEMQPIHIMMKVRLMLRRQHLVMGISEDLRWMMQEGESLALSVGKGVN